MLPSLEGSRVIDMAQQQENAAVNTIAISRFREYELFCSYPMYQ